MFNKERNVLKTTVILNIFFCSFLTLGKRVFYLQSLLRKIITTVTIKKIPTYMKTYRCNLANEKKTWPIAVLVSSEVNRKLLIGAVAGTTFSGSRQFKRKLYQLCNFYPKHSTILSFVNVLSHHLAVLFKIRTILSNVNKRCEYQHQNNCKVVYRKKVTEQVLIFKKLSRLERVINVASLRGIWLSQYT